jgi:lysophospholipase L1-like esterase
VAAALARRHPGLVSENLGCPGETTLTYLHGHCPFLAQHLALHTHYSGPQQQAALRFLRSQHGRPGLVTVSVGANDVGPAVVSCGLQQVGGGSLTGGRCRLSVLRAVLAGLDRRLGRILHRLRAADPAATVVLLEPYNPYAEYAPGTDRWMRVLVPALASVARTAGVRPVTAFAAFNRTPGEKARLCRWTGICQLPPDIHPTDAGYAELARLLLRAA